MEILGLFKKSANALELGGVTPPSQEDLVQCPCCKSYVNKKKVIRNSMVCPECGYHFRIGARHRIRIIADTGSFQELFPDLESKNVLNFPGYQEKLETAKITTKEKDAVVCGTARIGRVPCAVFAMEPRFMMGSMGSVVGEKITRLFEYATKNKLPVVGFTASGGARMQEGILSLMQMAKVSGAAHWHSEGGNLYITVLTDPTTGGVTASFAMQGDIILSEPKALVGFAGKRVIEQTTKRQLAGDFQTAEFLLSHGFVDAIVPRFDLRNMLTMLLKEHKKEEELL